MDADAFGEGCLGESLLERALASGKPALVNVEMRKDIGAMKGSTYV